MEIQYIKKDDNLRIQLEGGWVTEEIVDRVLNALKSPCWNFKAETLSCYHKGRGNVIDILVEQGRPTDVQEFCDYLNVIIRPVLPTGLIEIGVSPYNLPDYDNAGGLAVLMMIAKETGCDVDYGAWLKPVTFKPDSNVQYNAVIEHLRLFKMTFDNCTSRGH